MIILRQILLIFIIGEVNLLDESVFPDFSPDGLRDHVSLCINGELVSNETLLLKQLSDERIEATWQPDLSGGEYEIVLILYYPDKIEQFIDVWVINVIS